jgi:hypothetical protein
MDSYNFAAPATNPTNAPSQPEPSRRAPDPGGILFYGDPHGCFEPLIAAARQLKPAAVVLLGDCDLPGPLNEVLAPIVAMGCQVHWITGNHDTDNPLWYRRLTDAPGDLHCQVATFITCTDRESDR